MSDSLGIGIVGAGIIGNVHAGALEEVDGTRIVAIAEPREDAGQALASKTGGTWYASYEEMLASPDVDLVILATPSGLHADQAVLAAQAGKHIVTEKPMAITPDGLDRMIGAVESSDIEMAVIFQNRLSADVVKVKRAVEAGMIGKPILGNAFVHWHRTQEYYNANGGWRGTWALDGGGSLMNQSIHTIDLVQWIMGGVASVSANIGTLTHDIETEDTASANVTFRSGALGTIQGTTSSGKDWPVRVEIVGTGGRAVLEGGSLTHWEGDSELTDDILTPTDREFVQGWVPNEPFGGAHRRQLRLIVKSLLEGETPPVPGREARKAVDVILAIYEAARTGNRVSVS
ncbi:MAG TPA: Gfo/Idh/MocA family oxidoreductase [Thermomicrobiales bacterium]|nr:Gfo/Idh/MocA family oxidoreductase [Thermomicrobiales bacterium]